MTSMPEPAALIASLGGRANIRSATPCASRLVVALQDASLADETALRKLGARGVVRLRDSVQILLGPGTDDFAARLARELA